MTAAQTTPRRGVLCVGSIVVDLGKVIDSYPEPERLAVIESVTPSTGGPAVNLAVDLAQLGSSYPLEVIGVVGDDPHGDFVITRLRALGIHSGRIRRAAGAVTSFTDAMIEKDGGARTFFHHVGANGLLVAADADLAASPARILHVGAPGLHPLMDAAAPDGGNGWAQLLAAGAAAGMHTNLELVSIDPQRIRQIALPCLEFLDSIVVNEIEAAALTATPITSTTADSTPDWALLEQLALDLIERGVHRLAVVHFPAGCVAATGDGRTLRQGSVRLPREQLVNAVGAGDAFASGVLHGLHEGWPVERLLVAGVCVAAASLRGTGTSDGVLPLADCLALSEAHGYRPTATVTDPQKGP
jgi:sugar/nucleoside kinase (ribokinase family)